jgi:hypothetical protein
MAALLGPLFLQGIARSEHRYTSRYPMLNHRCEALLKITEM